MKNRCLILLFVLTTFAIKAQDLKSEFGIKVGGNLPIASGELKQNYGNGILGYNAGLFLRENKGKVNVLMEVFYNSIAVKKPGYSFRIQSLNLPILLETNVHKVVSFYGGVTGVFNLWAHKTNIPVDKYNQKLQPLNIDLTTGLNFKLADRIGLGTRFTYPLLNSSSDEDINYRPMSLMISLNYTILKNL